MGLIEERGEEQSKHEDGQGDESPGEKEEPQNRSRQPEFPSWQVTFSSHTIPREGRAGMGGAACQGQSVGWEGCCQLPRVSSGEVLGTRSGGVRRESYSVKGP